MNRRDAVSIPPLETVPDAIAWWAEATPDGRGSMLTLRVATLGSDTDAEWDASGAPPLKTQRVHGSSAVEHKTPPQWPSATTSSQAPSGERTYTQGPRSPNSTCMQRADPKPMLVRDARSRRPSKGTRPVADPRCGTRQWPTGLRGGGAEVKGDDRATGRNRYRSRIPGVKRQRRWELVVPA